MPIAGVAVLLAGGRVVQAIGAIAVALMVSSRELPSASG
jgi:hypothetical protein